jgi:exopolysaccharide biosynthesis WecB/TagA/CpsF family protein
VDAVDLPAAVEQVMRAARDEVAYQATALAVHGVMTGALDKKHRVRLNRIDLIVPDGQPVRWALNWLYQAGLKSSVRGTDLTLALLASAEREGLPVFFYGSTSETLQRAQAGISSRFPHLQLAGTTPSLFKNANQTVQASIARTIRESGAKIVFVGIGCPRQEAFVSAMAGQVGMPMIAVGAAFDYLAGNLREPPLSLRRWGLEWGWRLVLEPRRLWRRYLLLNPAYLFLLALQTARIYRPVALTALPGIAAEIAA